MSVFALEMGLWAGTRFGIRKAKEGVFALGMRVCTLEMELRAVTWLALACFAKQHPQHLVRRAQLLFWEGHIKGAILLGLVSGCITRGII